MATFMTPGVMKVAMLTFPSLPAWSVAGVEVVAADVLRALAEPAQSAVVRVRDGVPVVTDGPYLESKEFMGGYYIVDCATRERALELAALIPDAGVEGLGIEVRPIIFSAGPTD